MSRLQRTQILLEPEQHEALARIARDEGRSVSDLIREIVRADLLQRNEDAAIRNRLDAIDRIRAHRDEILRDRGGRPLDLDVTAVIDRMREERDEQVVPENRRRRRQLHPPGDIANPRPD